MLDLATRRTSDYFVNPKYALARARFSPDGRWVAFMAFNAAGGHVAVVPFQRDMAPRADQWVSITEPSPNSQDKPRWSPDGRLIYYLADIDGYHCIWAQRLDPDTKRPLGQPLEVSHWHSARRSLMEAGMPLDRELSVTAHKLFFNLAATTGNIWMAEWKRP